MPIVIKHALNETKMKHKLLLNNDAQPYQVTFLSDSKNGFLWAKHQITQRRTLLYTNYRISSKAFGSFIKLSLLIVIDI